MELGQRWEHGDCLYSRALTLTLAFSEDLLRFRDWFSSTADAGERPRMRIREPQRLSAIGMSVTYFACVLLFPSPRCHINPVCKWVRWGRGT
jgi:hypothetical protein